MRRTALYERRKREELERVRAMPTPTPLPDDADCLPELRVDFPEMLEAQVEAEKRWIEGIPTEKEDEWSSDFY